MPRPTLTYSVPEELRARVQRGSRVIVPLGKRFVTGYCIRTHDDAPAVRTRPVREAPDETPVFAENLVALAEWMHEYYQSPLGDALKAALPQGIDRASEEYACLATSDLEEARRRAGKSPRKRAVLEALENGEYVSVPDLAAATGYADISRTLRAMESEGTVRLETVLSAPKISPKRVLAVCLLPPWTERERLRELLEILEPRAPKQVNILMVLARELERGRASMSMAELVREARASSAQVRALEEKEVVAVIEEEVLRLHRTAFEEPPKKIEPTAPQRDAVERIAEAVRGGDFHPFLLHGVTASGKTQVYIDAIRRTLDAGKNAIVLVPEIALTPQLVHRFQSAFGALVAVLHSRMALGERYDAWRMLREGKYRVVVGVRSAVFAPLAPLGLIVVDEEHDSSYKQSDMHPRYHARDAAVVRARLERAAVVLGSATPSCESWHNARTGKYALLSLPERIGNAPLPSILLADLTEARKQNRMRGSLTFEMAGMVEDRLRKKEGIILLQNRRGFAPRLECAECGFVPPCDNCSISLTYHKTRRQLRCHYCGAAHPAPDLCPRCGGARLDMIGVGTQRVEEDLAALFPEARILRMDLDTTSRRGSHDAILTAFFEGEADILLGTQMVSKGLDFPRVTLVGVINADQSLLLPDFRAGERAFQLLTQVSGRSGRGETAGEVVIQTARPDHPLFARVIAHDYEGFMEEELRARREFDYPPFSRLVLVEFSGSDEARTAAMAERFARKIPRESALLRRHDPVPAAIARINRRYRYHLLLKVRKSADPNGRALAEYLRRVAESVAADAKGSGVAVTVDVDAQSMM